MNLTAVCKEMIAIQCDKLLSGSLIQTDVDLKVVLPTGETMYDVRYFVKCFVLFNMSFLKWNWHHELCVCIRSLTPVS